jgi:hypothetical protein
MPMGTLKFKLKCEITIDQFKIDLCIIFSLVSLSKTYGTAIKATYSDLWPSKHGH